MGGLIMQAKLIGAVALAMIMTAASSASARDLVIAGWGGNYQDAQRDAYFKPFTEETGQKFIETTYLGGLAEIKAMVDTGNATWDFLIMGGSELQLACDEGLLEPLDWDAIGGREDLLPGAASDCGVGNVVIGNGYSYNTEVFPVGPKDWADFFDREKFPGKRAVRNNPLFNLEYALIADGVPVDQIYDILGTPEGVDRAFAQWDKIKDLLQYWESGAQPVEWLASKNVALATGYNGRVVMAQAEGQPLEFVWRNHIVNMDAWGMVKGSPHKEHLTKFIQVVNDPINQAKFSEHMPYGPSNTKSADLIPVDILKGLPAGENIKSAAFLSDEFWIDNLDELRMRWDRWSTQ
ncbi:ABC transporter substrate-binding protein [Pseudochrobactrum sp. MP213Fo]|uniref:ABC transporter substrate-binding protein n=1 Tax=Pseudochrobactrum sp. MP213Fo TaxID=3022250 RepID=UPI003BA1B144